MEMLKITLLGAQPYKCEAQPCKCGAQPRKCEAQPYRCEAQPQALIRDQMLKPSAGGHQEVPKTSLSHPGTEKLKVYFVLIVFSRWFLAAFGIGFSWGAHIHPRQAFHCPALRPRSPALKPRSPALKPRMVAQSAASRRRRREAPLRPTARKMLSAEGAIGKLPRHV